MYIIQFIACFAASQVKSNESANNHDADEIRKQGQRSQVQNTVDYGCIYSSYCD